MTGDTPAPRLTAAHVRALRRAAQRQLTRLARHDADAEVQRRSADLRAALRTLRSFRDGCALHPIDDRDRGGGPP